MLITVAVVILILWLLGFIGHVAGAFIHVLLVVGLIVLILHFVRGRGSRNL